MSGATLKDLSEYHQRAMQYFKNGLVSEQNRLYASTAEAGAVSFWPLGGTPLEGKVKFSFKETPPASGDKGPENPSTITGVSNINTRQLGANLAFSASTYRFSSLGDGFYGGTINNTAGTQTLSPRWRYLANEDLTFLDPDKNYCCVIEYENCDSITIGTGSTTSDKPFLIKSGAITVSGTGILKSDLSVYNSINPDVLLRVGSSVPAGSSITVKARIAILKCSASEVDLNTYKYDEANNLFTIDLGGTYYGGEIDLATGLMTVTMQYMVADSNADIVWIGTNFVAWRYPAGLNCIGRAVGTEVCSHFPFSGAWDGSFAHFYATLSSGLYIANPNWTASTYRQYFTDQYNNGTPVTACYQLADPITVQLTPTEILSLAQTSRYEPRLNTVYTDADSIQIRYRKSLIHDEDEKVQAIVALGGNV